MPTGSGCSHQDAGIADNNNLVQSPTAYGATNPCSGTSGDSVGAFYVGFAANNTSPGGSASRSLPVAPGQGIVGLQG